MTGIGEGSALVVGEALVPNLPGSVDVLIDLE